MGELASKPWVWIVGLIVGALLLMGGRKGGGSGNVTEVSAIAAGTNVQLSSIAARTAESAYAYRTRVAELDAGRDAQVLDLFGTGLSKTSQALLQREVYRGQLALAKVGAAVAARSDATRLAAIKHSNVVQLKLGQLAASVRGKEIAIAPKLASIAAQTQIVTTQRNAARDERIAAYDYRARKAGYSSAATADMVGSAFDFADDIF